MMEVKVLGTGCPSCKTTFALIESVAGEQGLAIELVKVEALEDIMAYGVASTPAVVIDGVVVHVGGVPSRDRVKAMLASVGQETSTQACCAGGGCADAPAPAKGEEHSQASCASGQCGTSVGARQGMGVGALINLMAGSMILLGFVLAHLSGTVDLLSPSWLWLPVFVGLNLIQFAFTGFCPAKKLFEKLGVKPSCC